jgi:prepilin-type N-terminal cleavage/methylation domain-containing protein
MNVELLAASPPLRASRGGGPARRRGSQSRGFTAIEVLIAMTVMVIGATAVMSMQKTSIQGNFDARRADVASSIARTWVERMRRAMMRWTQPTPAGGVSNLPKVPLINAHTGGGWFRPSDDMIPNLAAPGAVEAMSYAFDILGRDLATADAVAPNVEFCAEARLTPIGVALENLYRLDVRVIWPRGIESPTAAPKNWCANTTALPDIIDPTMYHSIYVTTAIEENATQ